MKNTFGQSLTVTLFGESHGAAVGAVVDGLAPGLPVSREEIERQLTGRGLSECVTLTGYMENPCPLLARCRALVLFSEYEGTPVTIDEAKALGVSVIANDVGGVAEMLEGGKFGTAANDTESFIQSIMQL